MNAEELFNQAVAKLGQGDIFGAIADFQTAAIICFKRRNMAFYQQIQETIAQHQQ
ncbi:hypothetical protein H6S82_11360 [Planktothrix sp. FACHB-1355]|uniref:Uncharacterized protein n=1 Tax=Aerosakkonema funiforme FACHB-1375 TaxID=2949571 RepID=A0A926VFM3_9CYAN|nr:MULTISPECIES: hypothetical protein [Oscillatoriales]MBD2182897.1 hypothetical protein [Aerosakkonema funiforme FACHB-1375]MBD3559455.1 hypothetical protein [Planktothrix sp. FACHB-1355]